jgi:predicted AAA+ superfamily ATPase
VGKSTLVREFAAAAGLILWEINLEKYKSLNTVFGTLDPKQVLQELALTLNVSGLGRGKGILFLDEIQETPNALACLRYFHEELPDLAVIAAGSLLEFTLSQAEFSMPVGRVEYYWLGPLTFDEYMEGSGEHEAIAFLETWKPDEPYPKALHDRLLRRLREFLLVGGMPEALQTFLETSDFRSAVEVHQSILETYRDDFSKYARGAELEKLRRVFDVIPRLVGRKVQYRQYHPDWKAQDIRHCLDLLQRAGLAFPVLHASGQGLPLGAGEDPMVWKIFFLDVGLAGTANGNGLLSLEAFLDGSFYNEGAMAEQFAAQHLAAAQPHAQRFKLHYWLREGKTGNAELDFLIPTGEGVVPIEVKAGSSGSLRSLHQFMAKRPGSLAIRLDLNAPSLQEIRTTVISPDGKQDVSYRLRSLPLYMAGNVGLLSSRGEA